MRIEIWSDVVCPWCYVGKRRLEEALAAFPHADQVEVVYRSFELDPSAPAPATEPVLASLARKYGGGLDNARRLQAQATEVAAAAGLDFRLGETMQANTFDAHRLLQLALDEGGPRAQAALKETLLAAYFTRGEDITDRDLLRKSAADAGLDPSRVDAVLGSREYADAVHADVDQVRALGAGGVPFFVIDGKHTLSGAQPTEVFAQLLERAWNDSRPATVTVVGPEGADGAVCGPDGCET